VQVNNHAAPQKLFLYPLNHADGQLISHHMFDVLGGDQDPTGKKFSLVNSYRQDFFLHAKHSLGKPPHVFGSHKKHKVCDGTTVLQSRCCDLIWLYVGQSKNSAADDHDDRHSAHMHQIMARDWQILTVSIVDTPIWVAQLLGGGFAAVVHWLKATITVQRLLGYGASAVLAARSAHLPPAERMMHLSYAGLCARRTAISCRHVTAC